MGVYKDKNRGNWYVSYRYVDSFGNRKRKYHSGFRTRAEAHGGREVLRPRLGKEKTD